MNSYSEQAEVKKDTLFVRNNYVKACKLLQTGNIQEAFSIFNNINSIHGCAYCRFLQGNITEAKILLNLIKGESSAVNWLIALTEIIEGTNENYPTYLQIRNFYEQDLDMLLMCEQTELAGKIIAKNSVLEYFNREIYKYSARVLFNYNQIDKSEKLLRKSLDIFYNDPETHFLLGEIYLKQGKIQKAKGAFETANEVSGLYGPAYKKIIEIERNYTL